MQRVTSSFFRLAFPSTRRGRSTRKVARKKQLRSLVLSSFGFDQFLLDRHRSLSNEDVFLSLLFFYGTFSGFLNAEN